MSRYQVFRALDILTNLLRNLVNVVRLSINKLGFTMFMAE